MKRFKLIFILLLTSFFSFSQEIHCKLEGKIFGRESKSLILIKEGQDPNKNGIKIPVKKDNFSYDLALTDIVKYCLVFEEDLKKFGYQPICFYPENCTVNFELYPDRNVIKGGIINEKKENYLKFIESTFGDKFNELDRLRDSIYNTDNYYSPEASILLKRIDKTKNAEERSKLYKELNDLKAKGKSFSPATMEIINMQDSAYKEKFDYELGYIEKNQDIFSYSLLIPLMDLYPNNKNLINIEKIKRISAIYFQKFPNQSYTLMIKEKLKELNE